jgi:hypothetical protein
MNEGLRHFVEHNLNSSEPLFRNALRELLNIVNSLPHPFAAEFLDDEISEIAKIRTYWEDNANFGIDSWKRIYDIRNYLPENYGTSDPGYVYLDLNYLEDVFVRETQTDESRVGIFAEISVPQGIAVIHFHYNDFVLLEKPGFFLSAMIYSEKGRSEYHKEEKFFTFESLRSNQPARRTRSLYE